MDDSTIRNEAIRQQRIREKRLAAAKRRRLRFLFFCCVCIAAFILIVGFFVKGSLSTTGQMQPQFALSADGEYGSENLVSANRETQRGTDESSWSLILVNEWNQIPESYSVDLTELSNGQKVDSRIFQDLQTMFEAARADGIYPIVAAGYRTAEKQQSLMNEKISELLAAGYSQTDAEIEAKRWVAVPGASEHQLGLAVDINADGIHSAGHEVYEWPAEWIPSALISTARPN